MRHLIAFRLVLIGLVLAALIPSGTLLSSAQETTPCTCPEGAATPSAAVETSQRLLGRAELTVLIASPAQMSVIQLVLAPGDATEHIAYEGPVLIVVQDGTVTLNADAALISSPPQIDAGVELEMPVVEPAAANNVAVTKGEQISLGMNASAQFRNETGAPVRLLLVTLEPHS